MRNRIAEIEITIVQNPLMLGETPVHLHTVYPRTRLDSDFGMRSLIGVQDLFCSASYSAEILE